MAEIKGKCIAVLPIQRGVTAKGEWQILTFVIEYGDEYPKKAAFQLMNKKAEMTPKVGDHLTVHYSPESKESTTNGKWFTNLNCWKLEGFTGNLGQQASAPATSAQQAAPGDKGIGQEEDGLPF